MGRLSDEGLDGDIDGLLKEKHSGMVCDDYFLDRIISYLQELKLAREIIKEEVYHHPFDHDLISDEKRCARCNRLKAYTDFCEKGGE